MFHMLCLRWAQLGVKPSPRCQGAKLRHARLQFGVHQDRFGAHLQPNMTNWRQLGLQLGRATWGQIEPLWGQPGAKPEPILRVQSYTLKACTLPLFPTFCGFDGGSREAMLPTLGLSWAHQVAHAKPNLCPNVLKLRYVGPQLG